MTSICFWENIAYFYRMSGVRNTKKLFVINKKQHRLTATHWLYCFSPHSDNQWYRPIFGGDVYHATQTTGGANPSWPPFLSVSPCPREKLRWDTPPTRSFSIVSKIKQQCSQRSSIMKETTSRKDVQLASNEVQSTGTRDIYLSSCKRNSSGALVSWTG